MHRESDKSRLIYLYPLHGSESDGERSLMYLPLYRLRGVRTKEFQGSLSLLFMFLYLYGGGSGILHGKTSESDCRMKKSNYCG